MMTLGKIKVGVVQATPALFDIEKTVEIVINWIKKGEEMGCELLLFPESFIPCYPRGLSFDAVIGQRSFKSRSMWLNYWDNSLVADSEYTARIGTAIKEAKMFVALGVTEREVAGGSLFCSLFYFNSHGQLIGKHRKLKPTGLERYIWADGGSDSLLTFNTDIGRIGGLICWENYMPLARTAMYQKGVEIYLAPTADTRESWQSTIRHIALEGRCFVLSANQYVTKSDYPSRYHADVQNQPEIMSSGGSVIVGPDGEILAGPLWNQEGLLTAELDLEMLYKFKLDFDVVGHYSRSDIFKFDALGQPDILKA